MQDMEPVAAGESTNKKEISAVRYEADAGAHAEPVREQAKPTGQPAVDAMIARLDGVGDLPLEEHVAVFDDVHTGLRQVLSELDTAGPDGHPGPGRPTSGEH